MLISSPPDMATRPIMTLLASVVGISIPPVRKGLTSSGTPSGIENTETLISLSRAGIKINQNEACGSPGKSLIDNDVIFVENVIYVRRSS